MTNKVYSVLWLWHLMHKLAGCSLTIRISLGFSLGTRGHRMLRQDQSYAWLWPFAACECCNVTLKIKGKAQRKVSFWVCAKLFEPFQKSFQPSLEDTEQILFSAMTSHITYEYVLTCYSSVLACVCTLKVCHKAAFFFPFVYLTIIIMKLCEGISF